LKKGFARGKKISNDRWSAEKRYRRLKKKGVDQSLRSEIKWEGEIKNAHRREKRESSKKSQRKKVDRS